MLLCLHPFELMVIRNKTSSPEDFEFTRFNLKRGSSVVRHLRLVLEVPGSIPARGEKIFGVRIRFL